jgi:hypothetical protein
MRIRIACAALLMLAACHKRDPAQETAQEAAVTDAVPSSSPSPPAPPAMPSMIAPVGAPASAAAKVAGLPEEVTHLSDRISQCEHFAGEEPYDAERGVFLRQQIAANCPGNAAELKRLRQKYAANPAVTKHLTALEAIEM